MLEAGIERVKVVSWKVKGEGGLNLGPRPWSSTFWWSALEGRPWSSVI